MSWDPEVGSLALSVLQSAYRRGLKPTDVIAAIYDRIAARGEDHVWIHLVPRDAALAHAQKLEVEDIADGPLWGVPFSVKDCNDVPGLPTTNALPPMAYVAETTGPAIQRLLDAGAICIGKTNMDQFGIGLVGVRTPYGACASVFSQDYISGGSSSGSAVSVAAGLVSFSIGNDAAGSGRVPAAFNNIVGIKPTPGLVSNSCVSGGGCVKTLETVSVFALTVEDGMAVTRLIAGFDADEPFSKPEADQADLAAGPPPPSFRFGVPAGAALRFFGDREAERLFKEAVHGLEAMGGAAVPVDFSVFEETQRLLYDGPWIAERALTLDPIIARYRQHIHPVTFSILDSAKSLSGTDVFRGIHRLAELKRDARPIWQKIDVLIVPTTPTIYRHDEVAAEPIVLNSNLGIYTNFVNLMGLAGVAVPNGFRADGLPQGVTFLVPSFQEGKAARLAAAFHAQLGGPLGATETNNAEIQPPNV
ncbi:MAG: allophanate hydrolase [Pseudomonadota bacterium]